MKRNSRLLTFCLLLSIVVSCTKNNDITAPQNLEVQDFIWEGLNFYYLWKDNVPDLSDTKIDDADSYLNFLSVNEPEVFFESLIYDREDTDKWSWIVDDYVALENSFQGISKSNGVEYGLFYEKNSDFDIFGYVRYILPNSDASGKNVHRGYIFDAIDGVQLTIENYKTSLSKDTYTMIYADYNDGNPVSNGESVELTKSEYQENPVYITKTLDVEGVKIGYLMYNGFTSVFDKELNAAFAQLKAEGATELVLDLRYNGGGSVRTATYLAGMITGQFKDELLTKEKWNNGLQEWFEENHSDWLINSFTDEIYNEDSSGNVVVQESINSLNLTKLYVLVTGSSASASELIINGLNPYINVVTIGDKTAGKYTASITLYDSDNLSRTGDNLNENHTWAMQPIVLEEVNKIGVNEPNGFEPIIPLPESLHFLGELGNEDEPLLAAAIFDIINSGKPSPPNKKVINLEKVPASKELTKFGDIMYVEKILPSDFMRRE